MKKLLFPHLFFSPRVLALPLAALLLAGCATQHGNQQHHAAKSMAMCSADKGNMGKGGCSCCGMSGDGMSHSMKDKPMGMMDGGASAPQGAMCMPGKSGSEKGGGASCGMEKMGAGGCGCCGMGKKEMSPEMKQKHMEMMRKHHPEMNHGTMSSPPAAK